MIVLVVLVAYLKFSAAPVRVAAACRIPHDTAVRNDGGARLARSNKTRSVTSARDRLAAGFANPPSSARPHTWWHWCNGNISKDGITADLEAMKKAGIGRAAGFKRAGGSAPGTWPFFTRRGLGEV